jgi:hypothetical protein
VVTDKLQTPYGIFSGITTWENYSDGSPKGILLEEQNVILTHAGELIPFYGDDSPRRKYKPSVTFHKNGMIKAVQLNAQQGVMTPIGELPAELITFYDTGEIRRVFPLDGKISGFWSEEDERTLNIPLSFDFGFTSFTAMISGLCFYKSGMIRSLTLFPGETVDVKTARFGTIRVRHGFSLYESGALKTAEPAEPVNLQTPVGMLTAYDDHAHGIHADANSLGFDEQGRVISLSVSNERLSVCRKCGGVMTSYVAKTIVEGDEILEICPFTLQFDYDNRTAGVTDPDGNAEVFSFDDSFFIFDDRGIHPGCSESACKNCTLCKNK